MNFILVADYNRRCKQIRDEIVQLGYDPRALFRLLLNIAQFEFLMKEVSSSCRSIWSLTANNSYD